MTREYSRHASQALAHRQLRWLEECREGNLVFRVEFAPMRDDEHPWRVVMDYVVHP